MEALIHHFKLVTEGFRVPPGEAYLPIEGPRGELGCFVVADGSAKPARVHMRDPSFVNLQALRDMAIGGYIADLITNLAMLDPILGGIDRMKFDHLRGTPGSRTGSQAQVWEGAQGRRPTRPRCPSWHEVDVPPQLRADDRAADGASTPTSARPCCRRCARRSDEHGWLSPEAMRPGRGGDARDARLPGVGRELLRHARARARRPAHDLRLHEHLLHAARRRRVLARALRGDRRAGRTAPAPTASSTCARSSAWAPATSRRWPRSTATTAGRSTPTDARHDRRAPAGRRPRRGCCPRRATRATTRGGSASARGEQEP